MSVSVAVMDVVRKCEGKSQDLSYLLILKGGSPTIVVGHGVVGHLKSVPARSVGRNGLFAHK